MSMEESKQKDSLSVSFRIAQFTELLIIAKLMSDFNCEAGYPSDAVRTQALLETFLTSDRLGHLWLLLTNGEIIGYLALCYCFSFEHGGRTAIIDELYIVPANRAQGAGRAAVQFAQDFARANSVHLLQLEVEANNHSARRLYNQSGFQPQSRQLMIWPTDTDLRRVISPIS